jgi:hypothetical protein
MAVTTLLLLPALIALRAPLTPAQGIAQPMDPATSPGVYLPDGGPQRAWAGVGPETVPAPTLDGSLVDAWKRWGELLVGERNAARPTPAARRELALFALDQGRHEDAWGHFAACGAEPELLAAIMARFLPGAPASARPGPGGLLPPLPNGVLLAPVLPPRTPTARPGVLEWRSASVFGLRVGEATLALRVAVESTGVQVDLQHISGGQATLRLTIPEPPGYQIRVEYVDWFRQDTLREPLTVEIRPGDRVHTLFGRFLPRPTGQPVAIPGHVPAQLLRGGMRFTSSGPPSAELRSAAAAIGALLGVSTVVAAGTADGASDQVAPPGSASPWSGTTVRVPTGEEGQRVLARLASAIEARLLP